LTLPFGNPDSDEKQIAINGIPVKPDLKSYLMSVQIKRKPLNKYSVFGRRYF